MSQQLTYSQIPKLLEKRCNFWTRRSAHIFSAHSYQKEQREFLLSAKEALKKVEIDYFSFHFLPPEQKKKSTYLFFVWVSREEMSASSDLQITLYSEYKWYFIGRIYNTPIHNCTIYSKRKMLTDQLKVHFMTKWSLSWIVFCARNQ